MNAPGAVKLINRVDVLQQLLAAVAVVPVGVKLSIPALRDALISQADVLAGLETLCLAGELDRATLRPFPGELAVDLAEAPAAVPMPASVVAPSGTELVDRLTEYCATHGLAQHRILKHLKIASYASLRGHRPQRRTVDKIQAFLAAPPPPGLQTRPSGGPRLADNGGITGSALAAELDALIEQHGLSKVRVGIHLNGNRHGVEVLRQSTPRMGTVEKVRALLANPPIDELKSRAHARVQRPAEPERPPVTKIPLGRKSRSYCQQPTECQAPRRGPCRICQVKAKAAAAEPEPATARPSAPMPARRDPTQKPTTPLMDLADRQRLNGQRHQANIRRSQEREASALLDQGVDPSKVKSTFQANTMRQVQERRDREARQSDPVEQAKLALQRRGRVVHSAAIHGGRRDRFMVGGQRDPRTGRLKELTPGELLDLAEKVTGQSFRRVA